MNRTAVPEGRHQLPMLGSYEDKVSATLRMLLEDCEEEMLYLFRGQCGTCLLQPQCFRLWISKVCNERSTLPPEEFVDFVHKFLKLKAEVRIQFRYRRVLCLR